MRNLDRPRPAARRRALLAAGIALLSIVSAVAVNLATQLVPGTWAWTHNPRLVWTAVALLALVTAVLAARPHQPVAGGDLPLAEVADLLAVAVGGQLEDEARHRRLHDPHPLPVAWDPAGSDVVEDWAAIERTAHDWPGDPPASARWATNPAALAGRGDELAAVLAEVPTGRLVVLGEPGAGKTMLLVRLLQELLAHRRSGGPVPVLLPLAGWNPCKQDLHAWIAARLAVDHPGLTEPFGRGGNRVGALLDRRLLLPILDGLDELSDARRGVAVDNINNALRPWEGVVVACRLSAYRQAVQPTHGPPVRLRGAAGIILRPLDPVDVREYLRRDAASPTVAARWEPVLAALGSSAPVGQALTTPLLVTLARTIYNPRPGELPTAASDPARLCDQARFPTPAAVQARLFGAFIPAAYRPHPDPRQNRWTADQAGRWLSFLARHLHHDRTDTTDTSDTSDTSDITDIAWWQLYRAIPRRARWLAGGLVLGLSLGLGVGLRDGLAAGLAAGLVGGLVGALAGGRAVAAPARGLRWSPIGLASGPVFGLLFGAGGGLKVGLAFGLAFGLVFGLERAPVDLRVAVGPETVLARDRGAFLTLCLAVGLALGLAFGLTGGSPGVTAAFAFGAAFAFVSGLGGGAGFLGVAWGWFCIARCWLALRRRLPWQLMAFLADARKRGVLRQAGAVYQFRHVELQHHLALANYCKTPDSDAGAGDHDAEYNLGLLLEELGRVEEAEGWYRKAAEAGDKDAIGALARLLEDRQR